MESLQIPPSLSAMILLESSTDLMRVLLAEDEKKVAQHIRTALREQGFTVDLFCLLYTSDAADE